MKLLTLGAAALVILGTASVPAFATVDARFLPSQSLTDDAADQGDVMAKQGRGRGGDDKAGDDRGGRGGKKGGKKGGDGSGSGRDKPRIPGGSGCDDAGDIAEHPECRG